MAGEPIEQALLREVAEETGLNRFEALHRLTVAYRTWHSEEGGPPNKEEWHVFHLVAPPSSPDTSPPLFKQRQPPGPAEQLDSSQ